jgi:ATP-binding cassette subfamily F protein 3
MIVIKNLSATIGARELFRGLDLTLGSGDRVGIVGANGAGKSTLLKIITGLGQAKTGTVSISADERVGYLAQDFLPTTEENVYGYLDYENAAFAALATVGLSDLPLDAAPSSLSGGQKTRLALAKILMQRPTALLLDEPTNHLDDEAVDWLAGFLREFRGSVLLVSHDRHFLNDIATGIIDIDPVNHRVDTYVGNYDDYLEERAVLRAAWARDYEAQRTQERRMEEWLVKKRIQATVHPNPATGRMIRNMERRIERDIHDKRIPKPEESLSIRGANLKGDMPSSKLVLRLTGVGIQRGERTVFAHADLEIRGNGRVRIAGPNGAGKTTMLDLVLGKLSPTTGEVRVGDNIRVGSFDQEHADLDPKRTVIEEYMLAGTGLDFYGARSVLGKFLFRGDDTEKRVGDLSPGERARLSFAKLMARPHDLLVLDEPTNHLDIPARETIEAALREYGGAAVVVSHDRYFLEQIGVKESYVVENGEVRRQ